MATKTEASWEIYEILPPVPDHRNFADILKIAGGWLIRTRDYNADADGITFVPDPDHSHKPIPIK